MPKQVDIEWTRFCDGVIIQSLAPATDIGGWEVKFEVTKRFGGGEASGEVLIRKSVASGLNGQSGITVVDSGQARMQIQLIKSDTSGLDPGVYAYLISRVNSGFSTVLNRGHLVLKQGALP